MLPRFYFLHIWDTIKRISVVRRQTLILNQKSDGEGVGDGGGEEIKQNSIRTFSTSKMNENKGKEPKRGKHSELVNKVKNYWVLLYVH